MKKIFLVCLVACACLSACERDRFIEDYPTPDWYCNIFSFAIYDSEGNNVTMQDGFNPEELVLEYEGKIFTPKDNVLQRVDDSRPSDSDRYDNSIVFEKMPHYNGELVAFRISGHTYKGEPARYVLRYRDNEWVVDYLMEKRKGDGKSPKSEAVVNGVKIEKEEVYNADKSICRIIYVLYTK